MDDFLNLFNPVSALWGTSMLRASVEGGIVIGLVWALCRAWPRMSPAGRSWLWRAAFCKLLLALCWAGSVSVPLLPTQTPRADIVRSTDTTTPVKSSGEPVSSSSATSASTTGGVMPQVLAATGKPSKPAPHSFSAPEDGIVTSDIAKVETKVESLSPQASLTPTTIVVAKAASTNDAVKAAAFAGWLLGALFLAARSLKAWRWTRQLREGSEPVADPKLAALLEDLRPRFALAHSPQMLHCLGIDALALTGVFRPAILLPSGFATTSATEEETDTALMLAHELAHQKRRDLAWGWLLWAGQTLFWFHPLVWLGAREWRLAQEVACDALAVQATRAPVAQYGAMLMKTALSNPAGRPDSLFSVAVSARYATLHRRLAAMKHFTSKAESKRAMVLCGALAIVALMPWRMTARAALAQTAAKVPRAQDSRVVTSAFQRSGPGQYYDSRTPQGTLRAFAAALTKADLTKAATYIVDAKPTASLSELKQAMQKRPTDYSVMQLRIAENGDTATLSFLFRISQPPNLSSSYAWAVLRRTPRGWKIDPTLTLKTSNSIDQFSSFVSLLSNKTLPGEVKDDISVQGSKLLRLGSVVQTLVADKEGRFALQNSHLRQNLLPYCPTLDVLLRPAEGQEGKVSFNTNLTNVPLKKVRFPQRTVMLYEGENGRLDFRHSGRAAVTFVAGDVRYVDEETAKKLLLWSP